MQQVLFLMLGYPGAGKTTVSKLLSQQTGAVHLWADHERKKRYDQPTYSHNENTQLYDDLNQQTEELLSQGKSVIFDTAFNYYADREKLRAIAGKHGAKAVVVWVTTPKDIARERATKDAHKQDNRALGDIPIDSFERMTQKLEPPRSDENVLAINGQGVNLQVINSALKSI